MHGGFDLLALARGEDSVAAYYAAIRVARMVARITEFCDFVEGLAAAYIDGQTPKGEHPRD